MGTCSAIPNQPIASEYYDTDAFIVKYGSSGTTEEWHTIFDVEPNRLREAQPGDLRQAECLFGSCNADDGGFVICGKESHNYEDYYLAKLYPDCNYVTGSPNSITVCAGATISGSSYASSPSGGTFVWTNSNTAIGLAASGTGQISSFTATNFSSFPITAIISVRATVSGCTGSPAEYTITVNPSVSYTVAPSSTVCKGTSVTFSGTGSTSYSWTGGITDGTAFTPSTTATYTVTGTNGNGCPNTATVTIIVTEPNVAPTVLNASTSNVCVTSNTVTLTQSGGSLGTSGNWKWYNNSSYTSLVGTGTGSNASLLVTPTVTTTYYLRAEGAASPCTSNTAATGNITVVVSSSAPGQPSTISGPQNLCTYFNPGGTPPSSATYTATSVTGAVNYIWSLLSGMTSTGSNIVSVNSNTVTTNNNFISITANQSTFVNGVIKVAASNACGNSTYQQSLSITYLPAVPGTISGPTGVCSTTNTTITYSVTNITSATNYVWSVPTGLAIASGQGTTSIVVNVTANTAVNGNITILTQNICGDAPSLNSKAVTSSPTGTLGNIGGENNICTHIGGSDVTYTISPVSGASSYTWGVPTGASITGGQGSTSVTISFNSSYNSNDLITVYASNNCSNTITRSYRVYKIPITPSSISVTGSSCTSGAVFSTSAVNGATSYSWNVPAGLSISSGQGTSSITTSKSGSISGNVTVASVNSCGTSSARTFTVSCANPIFVGSYEELTPYNMNLYPNPNNGEMVFNYHLGDNESGTVTLLNVLGEKVEIYKLITGSTSLNISEKQLPNGIYLYQVFVNDKKVYSDKIIISK